MAKFFKSKVMLIVVGLILGILIGFLSIYGNPINMGLCEINFIRDIAGSLRLHSMPTFQYFRPEIAGIILGSFIMSLITKKYRLSVSRAGVVKCILGFITMLLGMVFLGSPLRCLERMAGGDLNAYIGFVGLIFGLIIGNVFIKIGYDISDKEIIYKKGFGKFILPALLVIGLIILVIDTYGAEAANKILKTSEAGPASVHASVKVAIVFSFIIGILLEVTELSFDNAFKNLLNKKSFIMIISGIAIFVVLFTLNITSYNFNLSFDGQIVAHKAHIWNFLSMFGIGIIVMLADGDPLRQLIKAGEGSIDSMLYIVGMLLACVLIYPLKLTSSAYSMLPNGTWFVGGPIKNGIVVTIISLVIIIAIGIMGRSDSKVGKK